MIISHQFKFVFFSNPETGSHPVTRALAAFAEEPVVPFIAQSPDRPFYNEMSPAETAVAFRQNGRDLSTYTCLSCIESPFTRLPRIFERIEEVDRFRRFRRFLGKKPPCFDNWLLNSQTHGKGGGGALHERWRRYGTWTASHWSGGHIDHFIRREHLKEDLAHALAELHLPIPMPDLGAEQKPTPPLLTRNAIEIISIRYRQDLERFGYGPAQANVAA